MKGHILIIFVIIILSYYFSLFLEPYMTLTSSSIPKTIDNYIYISNSIINGDGAFANRDIKKNVILKYVFIHHKTNGISLLNQCFLHSLFS